MEGKEQEQVEAEAEHSEAEHSEAEHSEAEQETRHDLLISHRTLFPAVSEPLQARAIGLFEGVLKLEGKPQELRATKGTLYPTAGSLGERPLPPIPVDFDPRRKKQKALHHPFNDPKHPERANKPHLWVVYPSMLAEPPYVKLKVVAVRIRESRPENLPGDNVFNLRGRIKRCPPVPKNSLELRIDAIKHPPFLLMLRGKPAEAKNREFWEFWAALRLNEAGDGYEFAILDGEKMGEAYKPTDDGRDRRPKHLRNQEPEPQPEAVETEETKKAETLTL